MKQSTLLTTDQGNLPADCQVPAVLPSSPARTAMDIEYLRSWIGKTERCAGTIGQTQVAGLAAALDRREPPGDGDVLPPLWHWLFFQPVARQSELGIDGHPRRGRFLPPVPLPRRMWGGGRLQFDRPLRIGQVAVRDSVISALDYKHGRSGKLIIVTSRHEIKDTTGVVMLTEEQDIVYRDLPALGVRNTMPTAVPADPQWAQEIHPETSLLFRYSALTFNGHRIHYDRPYATEIEGYPGLVVQGPLIATLLLELLEKELPGAQVAAFSFRAVSPLFDTTPFLVCGRVEAGGKDVILWAQTLDGSLAISANANLV